jgi:hypothetical protein
MDFTWGERRRGRVGISWGVVVGIVRMVVMVIRILLHLKLF